MNIHMSGESANATILINCRHIINEYDNLATRVIFLHAGRYQWHNDDPKYGIALQSPQPWTIAKYTQT